ncbi:MAG: hypothetical protein A2Y33_09310 [Spirochaetes bacterium GWF1_51_8]|nr:MAG: hypothetical protein A2Y33_09310 [Spirochaetes bacterium GWF1_51_8]
MPRAFKPEERELIRRDIMKSGKELFSAYGIKRTNIEDIAKAAGIAKGSFYIFYDSKEELFMDIMEELEAKNRDAVVNEFFREPFKPRETMKKFLRYQMEAVEKEPIFRVVTDKDEYTNLLRRLPPERVEAHLKNDADHNITAFLSLLRDDKKHIAPEAISGLLKLMFFSLLHKKEIGENVFDKVLDLFIDIVCDSLIRE